jgi:hypothetical protein
MTRTSLRRSWSGRTQTRTGSGLPWLQHNPRRQHDPTTPMRRRADYFSLEDPGRRIHVGRTNPKGPAAPLFLERRHGCCGGHRGSPGVITGRSRTLENYRIAWTGGTEGRHGEARPRWSGGQGPQGIVRPAGSNGTITTSTVVPGLTVLSAIGPPVGTVVYRALTWSAWWKKPSESLLRRRHRASWS